MKKSPRINNMNKEYASHSIRAKAAIRKYLLIAILPLLAIMLALFAFSAAADDELPMYAALAKLVENGSDGIIIDSLTSVSAWTSTDESASISTADTPRIILVPSSGVSDFGATVTVDPLMPLDLLSETEISTNICIYSKAEYHKVSMTLNSDSDSVTYSAVIPTNEIYALYAPIDSLSWRNDIKSIEFRIHDEDQNCSSAMITRLAADSAQAAQNSERYSFASFAVSDGGSAASSDGITFIAGKLDVVEATAITSFSDHSTFGNTVGYSINLSVNVSATLTLWAGYGEDCTEITALNISPSNDNYYIPLTDGHPSYIKLKISFDSRDGEATLHSAVYLEDSIHTETFEYESLASISEFKYDSSNGLLMMLGTIPSSNVIDHISSELGVFAFRIGVSEYTFEAENAIARSKISTKFELTVAHDKLPYDFTLYRYVLAIIEKNEIIPISELMFPDLPTGDSTYYGSKVALHGCVPSNAFEANASNVIIDISLPLLTGGNEPYRTGTLVTRGTRYYYFNKKYIDELKNQIKLYDALGISVYLRLLIDADMSSSEASSLSFGGSSDAKLYAVNIDDPDGENLFLACAEYLSEEFPKIKGFILGAAIDDIRSSYVSDDASLARRAELHAKALFMLYNTAVLNARDIAVYTPISDGSPAACHITALVSKALESYGDVQWSLLIESSYYDENVADRCELIGEQISNAAATDPLDITVLWQVAAEADSKIADIFTSICTNGETPLISAYFLSLSDVASSGNLYQQLKLILTDANRITESYNADTIAPEFVGKYTLWDFQNEYSTLGWLNGGGCTSLNSQRADDGDRCLSARLTTDALNKFDGLMLCMLDDKHLLTASPIVAIELGISGLDDQADLIISFGDGETRAEYTITLSNTSKVTVYCDLSQYGHINSIDYIATRLSGSGRDVKLDVYSVFVASRSLSDDELSEIFTREEISQDTSESAQNTRSYVVAFMAIVLALSGIAFALLSKSNFENNKNNDKRKKGI